MDSYGKKIKDWREAKGITQDDMAKVLKVTRPTYNATETNKRDVTINELHIICKTLDLTLQQFLFSSTQPESYESKMSKFKQIILNCLVFGCDPDNQMITKTKLSGLVYLCDFAWFYKRKTSMSGLSYRHTEQGPIVDAYYRMIDELYDDGAINIELRGRAIMLSTNEPSAPTSTLSDKELGIIEHICKSWRQEPTQATLQFIKEQTPWKICSHGEMIPYDLILKEANSFLPNKLKDAHS